jgi:putative addiction module killer protein
MGYYAMRRVEATTEFLSWLDSLRDLAARARIQVRIDRLVHGNPGQHRRLGEGVFELKIDVGPGYRVYYALRGVSVVLLLAGGDKSSQDRDIAKAARLAKALKE